MREIEAKTEIAEQGQLPADIGGQPGKVPCFRWLSRRAAVCRQLGNQDIEIGEDVGMRLTLRQSRIDNGAGGSECGETPWLVQQHGRDRVQALDLETAELFL